MAGLETHRKSPRTPKEQADYEINYLQDSLRDYAVAKDRIQGFYDKDMKEILELEQKARQALEAWIDLRDRL